MEMAYISELRVQNQKLAKQNFVLQALIFVLLFLLMNIQYSLNLDSRNLIYKDYERGSQNLAEASIFAGASGLPLPGYGLGHLGRMVYAGYEDNIEAKIASDAKVIPLLDNHYIQEYMQVGLRFEGQNGEIYTLQNIVNKEKIQYLYFDKDVTLLRSQQELDFCKMLNTEGENIPFASITPYTKQFGLQGKVYYHIARLTSIEFAEKVIRNFCVLILTTVLMSICLLIHKKYKNTKLTSAFYLGFLLSPWISSFAPNFYWVEFTWFIPMLIGLLYVSFPKQKLIWFAATFIAVLAKSLCGFEYLSTILMGLVLFPVAEFFSISEKKEKKTIFCDTFVFTCVSIIGFLCSLGILANVLGNGNIIEGVQIIYSRDVLSKTLGGNPNNYTGILNQAVGSSIIEVVRRYFKFPTDIITGISGAFFVPMVLVGTVGTAYIVYKKEKAYKTILTLFVFSFFTTISWLVLGKTHSYIHLHLNFVLWYFGFIQMNLYICIYLANHFYINIINAKKRNISRLQ